MSKQTIAMDYELVDEYVATLKRASDALEDLASESDRLAAELEDDNVLRGRAGQAAVEALRKSLKGSVNRLRDRLDEAAQDVQKHAEAMRDLETENAGRF